MWGKLRWWRVFTFRKVAYCILGAYFLITCYYVLHYLQIVKGLKNKDMHHKEKSISDIVDDKNWNPWGEEFESEGDSLSEHKPPALWKEESVASAADTSKDLKPVIAKYEGNIIKDFQTKRPKESMSQIFSGSNGTIHIVEVWGKAAIGLYLWQHILEGQLQDKLNGVWRYGEMTLSSIKFRFRTGPGVVSSKVPRDTENVLLILNGREPSKIETAKTWLDSLPAFSQLQNVAVLLLGSEACNNSWIYPYMKSRGGMVKVLFLVYDSHEVDNQHVFQWPLGVATYRDFPVFQSSDLFSAQGRKYMFNFLGTIYPNSSRETLLGVINQSPYRERGYIRARANWLPEETANSRERYLYALSNSDLTLSPVGINSECYRIYEAISMGSVPVIEDIMTPGCGDSSSGSKTSNRTPNKPLALSPFRILKDYGAPVIYVKDWKSDLDDLLSKEAKLTVESKAFRRKALLQWYIEFMKNMRHYLVSILEDKFFKSL